MGNGFRYGWGNKADGSGYGYGFSWGHIPEPHRPPSPPSALANRPASGGRSDDHPGAESGSSLSAGVVLGYLAIAVIVLAVISWIGFVALKASGVL